ncbi:MAG: hypothetical protein KKE86_00185 [Planctomycetes bacterium]|nr:hypothetical protein [Planctomycetota bacterium]
MNRYSAPILLVLLFAGCRNHAPTVDPFFGRAIIPPPGTGSATGQYTDPYYQTPPMVQMPPPTVSQPAGTTSRPGASAGVAPPYSVPRPLSTGPSTFAPSTVAPPAGTNSPYVPPGGNPTTPPAPGWAPPRSTSSSTNAAGPGTTVSLPASAGVTSGRAGGSLDDRTPRPVDATGAGGNPSARAPIIRTLQPRTTTDGGDRVIDIMDLPPAS